VLGRWGGLGNHRYQVGFSGDVRFITWKHLAFQPYFSLTAANVGYGFWSHDVVGPPLDHELHTRWVQWASFSGVLRTHDRGLSSGFCNDLIQGEELCYIVEIWKTPDVYFVAMRNAMRDRVALTPYIYTAWRQAYDTGLSLLRPMYYEYPTLEMAYAASPNGSFPQYFFGDDMIVSPIVQPAGADQMAQTSIWIPPGTWIERDTGVLHDGGSSGTVLTKSFALYEVPVFVRAGAVIPSIPMRRRGRVIGLASAQYNELEFAFYPGATNGSCSVYEDDGATTAYASRPGSWAWTVAAYTRVDSATYSTITINITTTPADGTPYAGLPATRNYRLRLVNSLPAAASNGVMVRGEPLPYSRFGAADHWSYDGNNAELVIELASVRTSSSLVVVITTAQRINDKQLSGIKGAVHHALLAKENLDLDFTAPGSATNAGGYLSFVASAGDSLSYLAGTNSTAFFELLDSVPGLFQQALKEVEVLKKPIPLNSLVQFYHQDQDSHDNCLCGVEQCVRRVIYYQALRVEAYMVRARYQAPSLAHSLAHSLACSHIA